MTTKKGLRLKEDHVLALVAGIMIGGTVIAAAFAHGVWSQLAYAFTIFIAIGVAIFLGGRYVEHEEHEETSPDGPGRKGAGE